jgi:hypothetical protein
MTKNLFDEFGSPEMENQADEYEARVKAQEELNRQEYKNSHCKCCGKELKLSALPSRPFCSYWCSKDYYGEDW